MKLSDAKHILNNIIERHPEEVAQLYQGLGAGNQSINPQTLMALYEGHEDAVGEKLYEIYSSYEGDVQDVELQTIGFNGEEKNGDQQYSKFRRFLTTAKNVIKTKKKSKAEKEKAKDEEKEGFIYKTYLGLPLPFYILMVAIVLLIVIGRVRAKKG